MKHDLQWLEVSAPTGVAARNVEGSTLHSLFGLPYDGGADRRRGSALAESLGLDENGVSRADAYKLAVHAGSGVKALNLCQMRYLFVDEISMVGQKSLSALNEKLNEKFASKRFGADCSDHWLGGINVVSAGDFKQLAPIMQAPLWTTYDVQKECKTVGEVIDEGLTQQQERRKKSSKRKTTDSKPLSSVADISSSHMDVTAPVSSARKENILGRQVWEFMSSQNVIMLTEQMRVTDPVYHDILQHVRNGTCTEHHRKILQGRLVQNVDPHFHLGKAEWSHVPVVLSGNVQRECANRRCTAAFAHATGQPIVVFSAVDKSCRTVLTMPRHVKALQKMDTSTVYLPGVSMLTVGMPVMTLKNQSHPLDIANGTIAVLREIVLHPDDANASPVEETCGPYHVKKLYLTKQPLYICVEPVDTLEEALERTAATRTHPPTAATGLRAPNDSDGGQIADNIPQGWVPIFTESGSLKIYDRNGCFTVHRTTFPITAAFSMTFNKTQSLTLTGGAVVDLVLPSRVRCDPAAVYVMLSRVRTLDKLWVLRDFSLDALNALKNATAAQLKEIERLEQLDAAHAEKCAKTMLK
jgi:hypothetical protein